MGELSTALVRCNPLGDEPARDFDLDLREPDGLPPWTGHPNPAVDVAVVPVNFNLLKEQGMQVQPFLGDHHAALVQDLRDAGCTEGDGVFVLGFPMGLVSEFRNSVVVRSGSIARVRDLLAGKSETFLVDAFVFPGNSGGPVILRPEGLAITGTTAPSKALLVGIVSSYMPYQDVAISQQTRRPRIIFEENSGLAAVHPVDHIDEAIEARPRIAPPDSEPVERPEAVDGSST